MTEELLKRIQEMETNLLIKIAKVEGMTDLLINQKRK